jgi:hypothetical protein|tara:strand:+ start:120 stop:275 length:156 start_codon:yes stop_codon:yes gene_type:complete
VIELSDRNKEFLNFDRKVMVSRDGKKQVVVNNKLAEIKYKALKFEDRDRTV